MKTEENKNNEDKTGIFVKVFTRKCRNFNHGNEFNYQLLDVNSDRLLYSSDSYRRCGSSNVASFIACVWTIQKLVEKDRSDIVVYTNSSTAISWYHKGKCKADLATSLNSFGREQVRQLEDWLHSVNPTVRLEFLKEEDFEANCGRKLNETEQESRA